MSEPKLISPLLDNFVMGDPISDHNGVRCCPAIKKDTDEKYIVKIISVPASESQLEALLLSGAYSDKEAAVAYYKSVADDICKEAEILADLAQAEGFLSTEGWQIEPMDDGSGYDVYLLSTYRNTLRHQLRRNAMTHLQALNLGLDMCAALAVARRAGYLYVDLKPANIYLTDTQYRIGDLGFVALSSLQYASLPDRYRSAYTAPEIADAFSSLNTTIDIYAIGLILYQVYNDGQLPFKDDTIPSVNFDAPAYADYEMAEIILKACNIDPAQRWQDPMEMGQALVEYMQRNGVHDTPIIPIPEEQQVDITIQEEPSEGLYEERKESSDSEVSSDEAASVDESVSAEASDEDRPADDANVDIPSPEEITEESIYTEDEEGNLTFIEGDIDETMDEDDFSQVEYAEVTDEVSDMLQQADEIIAHEAPTPVVQPEPIDVQIPEVIIGEGISSDNSEAETKLEGDPSQDIDTDVPLEEVGKEKESTEEKATDDEAASNEISAPKTDCSDALDPEISEVEHAKKKSFAWVFWLIGAIVTIAILFTAFYGYKNYYLQRIDELTLTEGENGELTVNILSSADESLMTIVCTDTYGIQKKAYLTNGKAIFTDLLPNSAYNIRVIISGFHKLTGKTSVSYATPAQTEIIQFSAITGAEDGSVILSFTQSGPDHDNWSVTYSATNGDSKKATFNGHMTTITGLEVGAEYTFTLAPESNVNVIGNNTVSYVAKNVLKAENLLITGCTDGRLTATWSVAENSNVESWTVRCYNDGFDKTLTVDTCEVAVDVPNTNDNYIIEVTAAGMSVSARAEIPKNSLTVKNFTIDTSGSNAIMLKWDSNGNIQTEGWKLQYSVDGSPAVQVPITDSNSIKLTNIVPKATYIFELLTADGALVLGGKHALTTADAPTFVGYRVTSAHMVFKMCKTPNINNWDRHDLSNSDYTTKFTAGQKASFVIRLTHAYDRSSDEITALFVIRDQNGMVVDISTSTSTWLDMWYKNYCELDIPQIPQIPGTYTISTYFNGAYANTTTFEVVE